MPNIHSAFKIFLTRQRWWKIPQSGWASDILVALLTTKSLGWACVFCRRTILAYANKHICSAKNQRNCHDCSRIIMRKDLYYKTYLRTRDMYCDSGFANDYSVNCYLTKKKVLQNLRCPRCFCEFKTMNCAQHHIRHDDYIGWWYHRAADFHSIWI